MSKIKSAIAQNKVHTFKPLDPKIVPYVAILTQCGLFGYAGAKYFDLAGWLIGAGVGFLVSISITLSASRISEIAKARKPLAYAAMILLLSLSPSVIALSLFAKGTVFPSIAWAMAPDVSVVLCAAIVGKGILSQAQTPKKKTVARPNKSVALAPDSVAPPSKYPRKCDYCDEVLKSANSIGGHMKAKHPTLIHKKIIVPTPAQTLFEDAKRK